MSRSWPRRATWRARLASILGCHALSVVTSISHRSRIGSCSTTRRSRRNAGADARRFAKRSAARCGTKSRTTWAGMTMSCTRLKRSVDGVKTKTACAGGFGNPSSPLPAGRSHWEGEELLTLGPLWGAAGGFLAVLFALTHACVALQVSKLFERGAIISVEFHKRTSDPEAHGVGLAADAATRNARFHIKLPFYPRGDEWLLDGMLHGVDRKINSHFLFVDRNLAAAVRKQAHLCGGFFAAAESWDVACVCHSG